jgi:hypothetical protein
MLRVTAPSQRRELQKPRLWDVLGLSGHGYARWGDTQVAPISQWYLGPSDPLLSRLQQNNIR